MKNYYFLLIGLTVTFAINLISSATSEEHDVKDSEDITKLSGEKSKTSCKSEVNNPCDDYKCSVFCIEYGWRTGKVTLLLVT